MINWSKTGNYEVFCTVMSIKCKNTSQFSITIINSLKPLGYQFEEKWWSGVWSQDYEMREIDCYGTRAWTTTGQKYIICIIWTPTATKNMIFCLKSTIFRYSGEMAQNWSGVGSWGPPLEGSQWETMQTHFRNHLHLEEECKLQWGTVWTVNNNPYC